MIEMKALVDGMAESQDISAALSGSWKYADALRVSASSVASTFQWLQVNRLQPILLLDYDVICTAVPSLVRNRAAAGPRSQEDILSISQFSGPTMLRLLLQRVDECIIPPGTTAELLLGMERLQQNLSERARGFVERVRSVLTLDDPAEVLTESRHQRTRDLLLEDLTKFDEDIQDQRILQNILSRAVAVDSLLVSSAERNPKDIAAFRGSYGFLSSQRPGMSISNFNDALNAALVVRLFNNTAEQPGRVPVLISNTRAVRSLNGISESYLHHFGGLQERPFLFNDVLFLVIGQGLLERTQNRYGVASDAAAQIARDAAAIASGCLELLKDPQSLTAKPRRTESGSGRHRPDDLEMLFWRRSEFERKWGSIFAPASLAARRDLNVHLRLLLSQKSKGALLSARSDALAEALGDQLAEMTPIPSEATALWKLFLQHSDSGEFSAIGSSAFSYYLCANDGTLLRDAPRDTSLKETTAIDSLGEKHNFRIVMGPAYLSAGTVLSVASFLDPVISPRRYLSITWLHESDSALIVAELKDLFLTVADRDQPVSMSVFTELERIDAAGPTDVAHETLQEYFVPKVDGTQEVEFFQIRGERASVCADLQMLGGGTEMQANLTLSVSDLTAKKYEALIGTIVKTLEVPITDAYLRRVMEPVSRILSLGV
jgi:hypothetical protein